MAKKGEQDYSVTIQEFLATAKELITDITKEKVAIDKQLSEILEQIKHIKESIYLQERFHRGH